MMSVYICAKPELPSAPDPPMNIEKTIPKSSVDNCAAINVEGGEINSREEKV